MVENNNNRCYRICFVFLISIGFLLVVHARTNEECYIRNCTSVKNTTCESLCCDGWVKDDQGRCTIRYHGYKYPIIVGCPKIGERIQVQISKDQNMGILPNPFSAYDWEGERLHVWLQKQVFKHCLCTRPYENVKATSDRDAHGNTAVCDFIVELVDDTKPVMTNCPADQTKTEMENITWISPTVRDNVGVHEIHGPDPNLKNTRFKSGVYKMMYNATDWAGNIDKCTFFITVLSLCDNKELNAIKANESLMISGTIVGALLIIIGISAIAVFRLCRKRQHLRRLRGQSYQASMPASCHHSMHDNHVLNVFNNDPPPYEVVASDKLPEYSPPIKPPSYDEIGFQQHQTNFGNNSPPPQDESVPCADRNTQISNCNRFTTNEQDTSHVTIPTDQTHSSGDQSRSILNNRHIYSQSLQETNV